MTTATTTEARPARYDGRWGPVNDRQEIAPGIAWISATNHGGYVLTAERLDAMPEELRAESFTKDNYFEEDCSWAAVVVAFPEAFPDAGMRAAAADYLASMRRYRARTA